MKPLLCITPLLACLAATPGVSAAERMWDGGDATTNLNAAANWDGNTALNLVTDDLNFPSGVAAAKKAVHNNYPDLTTFRNLHYQDSGYTLDGPRMRLTDGITGNFASGSVNIDGELLISKSQTFYADGGGDINFVAGTQLTLNNFTLTLQARHANSVISYSGTILDNAGVIRIQDEGVVRMTSLNAYGSEVFVESGGTLEVSHDNALGSSSGATNIVDGTLVLNNAVALTVVEPVVTQSTFANPSTIESRGGAHKLGSSVDLGGSSETIVDVQGPSLTFTGSVESHSTGASLMKTGPGKLIMTGASFSPATLSSLEVLEGEVSLSKTNGQAFVSCSNITVGKGLALPESRIIRLGASNQLPDNSSVNVQRDGLLDLNGWSDAIGAVNFLGAGHIDTGGGTLRMTDLQAHDSTDTGATALITGNVTVTDVDALWQVDGDVQSINLKVDGDLTCPAGNSSFRKTGKGNLEITGDVSAGRFRVWGGLTKFSTNSPDMDLEIETGNSANAVVDATGTLGDVHIIVGKLTPAGLSGHGSLDCDDFTLDATGTLEMNYVNFLPALHDAIHVHGAVELHGSLTSAWSAPLPAAGAEIVLIDNDGTDPVIGRFSNLVEGAVVGGQYYISYKGGDGNDVSVTHIVPATGTTRTWDGGGTDNNWMTDNNWNPNGKPEEGDNLIFPVTASRKSSVNDYPAGTTFNSITVQGTAYIFNGNSIALNDKLEYTHTTASNACGLPVKVVKTAKISAAGTSSLLVSGALNTNNKTLTLEHTGDGSAGEMTVSAIISGTGNVVKSGPGDVVFSGNANTYTGTTTVTGGVLALTPASSLGTIGSTAGTSVENGAVLELRNNLGDVSTFDEIQLDGTLRDNGGNFMARFGGVTCLTDLATFEANGTMLSVGGAVSGAGNPRKTGAGRLTLDGTSANSWTGTLTIAGGEVVAAKPAGTNAMPPATVVGDGTDTTACRLTLGAANQIPDTATVSLKGKLNVFHSAAFQERFATLTFTGGTATGSAPGLLTLAKVETLASPNVALISAPLSMAAGIPLNLTMASGTAAPDLELSGATYGTLFEKNGGGSVNFTSVIPAAGLDAVKIKAGPALFMADCRYTNIELAGGTVGGTGTVGTVSVSSYGTVAPGSAPNPAPGRFSALASTWNSSTSLRLELNGLTAGTEYDQFTALAPLTLGGGSLVISSTFTPLPNAQFVIIRNDSGQPVNGTFENLPEGGYISTTGAKVFRITYHGGDGDDVMLTAVPAEKPQIVTHTMEPGAGEDYQDYWKTGVTAKGTPGLNYYLQYSTDLTTWSWGATATASMDTGAMSFEMYTEKTLPRCYFRVKLP